MMVSGAAGFQSMEYLRGSGRLHQTMSAYDREMTERQLDEQQEHFFSQKNRQARQRYTTLQGKPTIQSRSNAGGILLSQPPLSPLIDYHH
jgi:hypothetical protein